VTVQKVLFSATIVIWVSKDVSTTVFPAVWARVLYGYYASFLQIMSCYLVIRKEIFVYPIMMLQSCKIFLFQRHCGAYQYIRNFPLIF